MLGGATDTTAVPFITKAKPNSRARFQALTIFSLLSLTNAFLWIGFAPIEPLIGDYYGVSATLVNLLSALFMLLYAPGAVLSSYMLHATDMRVNVLVAGLLMTIGVWMRYFSSFLLHSSQPLSFAVLALGQGLAGLAQPALTNTPAKLAAEWFPNGERDMATTVASVANIVGNAVGQVVPSIVVACTTRPGSGVCEPGTVSGVDVLLLTQAVLTSAITVWAACSLRAEPATAPSASAEMRRLSRQATREGLVAGQPGPTPSAAVWADCKKLLANREFVKILVGFGVGLAFFNAMLTDLNQVIRTRVARGSARGAVARVARRCVARWHEHPPMRLGDGQACALPRRSLPRSTATPPPVTMRRHLMTQPSSVGSSSVSDSSPPPWCASPPHPTLTHLFLALPIANHQDQKSAASLPSCSPSNPR